MTYLTLQAQEQWTQVVSVQGHVSVQPHWLCTETIICIWFPEEGGGQVTGGVNTVHSLPLLISSVQQGQFIWKHRPALLHRGHFSTIHQGSVQHLPDEEEINTNTGSVWATHSTKPASVRTFFCWHKSQGQNTPTSLLPPDGWVVCTSDSYVTQSLLCAVLV